MSETVNRITDIFAKHRRLVDTTLTAVLPELNNWVQRAMETWKRGGKLLTFGNGGSAADACHLVAELVGRLDGESPALSALALNTDPAVMTSLANDYGYKDIFYRQVMALGCKGDMVVAISTSGNSINCLRGVELANSMGIATVSLTGKGGGKVAKSSNISVIVPSKDTQRIQEMHGIIIHAFCDIIKSWAKRTFPGKT